MFVLGDFKLFFILEFCCKIMYQSGVFKSIRLGECKGEVDEELELNSEDLSIVDGIV